MKQKKPKKGMIREQILMNIDIYCEDNDRGENRVAMLSWLPHIHIEFKERVRETNTKHQEIL